MKQMVGYLAFRALSALVGGMPEPVARRAGQALGVAASVFAGDRRRLVRGHLQRVLGGDVSERELRRRSREMFASYGRYWAEVFWVRPSRKSEIVEHVDVINFAAVERSQAAGRGSIFALPHVGNWEAAGAKAEAIGVPVLAVAEALPNERIVEWFVEVRNALGIDIVVARSGERVTGALADRLRAGGVVALVADRDIKGRGVPVRFFGEVTTMPPGPVALAERTGASLLPVGAYFKDGRGHRLVVHEPVEIPTEGNRRERVEVGLQRFAESLEEIIRLAPEQWHLFQPNWPSDR